MTPDELHKNFIYHAPHGDQTERYKIIRAEALSFAEAINRLCPESHDKERAILKVRMAVMLANASIAINEA